MDDRPEIYPNESQFELISPTEPKEEVTDPKAKAAKKDVVVKESNFTEEEEATFGPHKIYVEYKPDAEEQPEIAFNINTFYQGPEYEDPNPPEEEEVKKKPAAKGTKPAEATNDKPAVRMIKPDPVLMTSESGRTFQFEIGRMVKFQARPESVAEVVSQDLQSQKETNNQNSSPNLLEVQQEQTKW